MLPLILAGTVGAAVFLFVIGWFLLGRADLLRTRLDQLGVPTAPRSLEQIELEKPLFDRTLRPLVRRAAGIAQRIASPRRVSRTEVRLAQAGYPGNLRTIDFLGLKVLLAGLVGGGVLLFGVVVGRNIGTGTLLALIVGAIAFMVPEFWLGSRIRGRRRQILRAVPDALDLLTISVRAGLGFDSALAKVVERTKGPLADELRRALTEIRVGKTRREALRDVVARAEVPALTSFFGAIVQAEQMGVPIAKVLQVQSEQLRIERRQRAEEAAQKAPIKMLFPLVGCVFPALFIVILGPAAMLFVRNFLMN